jgi:hypothetical protein
LADEAETLLVDAKEKLVDIIDRTGDANWEAGLRHLRNLPKPMREELCTHALGAHESGLCDF